MNALAIGERGELVSGPPWIVGFRGSPLEAPENSLAGLRRALELGLDGVAYDVRATRDAELVLARDADLARTTSASGRVEEHVWRELADLDAGAWFGARFRGERLALLEDALALPPSADRGPPQHVLFVGPEVDLARVRALVGELAPGSSVRIAARDPATLVDARDLGLQPMLVADRAGPRERELVERERITALAAPPHAWSELAASAFECERWMLGADRAEDLLRASRAPFFGVLVSEPLRALATRALTRLAPHDDGAFPVSAPELEVVPGTEPGARGSWWGSWTVAATARNPLPFSARVTVGVVPRRGAFEIRGLPVALELAPGASVVLPFDITGGAWRPGGDPLLFARYRWRAGPGRGAGALLLDTPLRRVRRVLADVTPVRLELLRESPHDVGSTMVLRRSRSHLLVSVEGTGGLADVRAWVRLGSVVARGARGVRLPLPEGFERTPDGLEFTCGFEGVRDGERVLRRWAGGLPDEHEGGAPGRLLPLVSTRGAR